MKMYYSSRFFISSPVPVHFAFLGCLEGGWGGEMRNKCSNTNRNKLGAEILFFQEVSISDRAVFLNLLFTSLYSSFLIKRLSRGGSRQTIRSSHFIEER